MKKLKSILVNNNCYKRAKPMVPYGIIVHSTGANNPRLNRYVPITGEPINRNNWNQPKPDGRSVCVHGFLGKLANGEIGYVQTLPYDIECWGCGGSGNRNYIQFEICEDDLTNAEYFGQVYQAAVEVCADLCKQYNLVPKNIICHSEGYKIGIASNHADVMHWFPKFEKSMNTFREDVTKMLQPKLEPHQKFMIDNELMFGYGNGEYGWNDPLTRNQLALILYRYDKKRVGD